MEPHSPENLTDHSYDGIQEYDNPIPGWWSFLFWASFVFSIGYLGYFHLGMPGRSIYDEFDRAVAANLRIKFAEIGDLEADRSTITQYMNDPEWLPVGEIVFKGNCVSCHGADATGAAIGPNLTDDYWKNVRNIEDIAKVIANGAGKGAMPAWGNRLHPNEVVLTAAYIASLRGTTSGGKKAEGNLAPPWDSGGGTGEEKEPAEEVKKSSAETETSH